MVVETTWHNSTGWLIVQDLLVIRRVQGQSRREGYRRAPPDSIAAGVLLRTAKCISGYVDIDATCIPLFDFGRVTGQWSYENDSYGRLSVRRPDSEERLALVSSLRLSIAGARCYGRTNLAEGEEAFVALSWGDSAPTTQEEAEEDVASTVAYWRRWLATGRFPDHPWRPYIERSALTLKGLSYAPTGAVMAASTTSLPETPGGTRNWDYRFTWIRDTGFILRALYRLGFDWEALEYFAFVLEAVSQGNLDQPFELQIMYGIDGRRDLTESTLEHLSGYGGARPVRIGNGAWNQHQNDVWGMLMDGVDEHMNRVPLRSSTPCGRAWRVSSTKHSLTAAMPTRESGRSAESPCTSRRQPFSAGSPPTEGRIWRGIVETPNARSAGVKERMTSRQTF